MARTCARHQRSARSRLFSGPSWWCVFRRHAIALWKARASTRWRTRWRVLFGAVMYMQLKAARQSRSTLHGPKLELLDLISVQHSDLAIEHSASTSTHSRRIDPISLSAKPFCQGEPGAMGLSRMPIALSRRVAADKWGLEPSPQPLFGRN